MSVRPSWPVEGAPAVVGLAYLTNAAAQAPGAEQHPINGASSDTCRVWNDKANGATRGNHSDVMTRMVQTSWAQGYLTALNSAAMINGRGVFKQCHRIAEVHLNKIAGHDAPPASSVPTAHTARPARPPAHGPTLRIQPSALKTRLPLRY